MEATEDMIRIMWEQYLVDKLDQVDPDISTTAFTGWLYAERNLVVSTTDVLDALNNTFPADLI